MSNLTKRIISGEFTVVLDNDCYMLIKDDDAEVVYENPENLLRDILTELEVAWENV